MKFIYHAKLIPFLFLLAGLFLVPACSDVKVDIKSPAADAHSYDNSVYLEWNNTFMEIERYAPGYRPGPAPRALAYLGLSAYECLVPAMPGFKSSVLFSQV